MNISEGCNEWKNSKDTIKELLDYGYLEGECDGCLFYINCKKKEDLFNEEKKNSERN